MYYFPEPPFFLFAFGLFAGIASGLAFEATLKQGVKEYFKNPSAQTQQQLQGAKLYVPFIGICLGICVFLGAGLEIFGITPIISYTVALSLTVLIASLIWSQLAKLLLQLQEGGSRTIDLDAWD
jgi:hypothetical protein